MAKIISFYSFRDGTGKTTITANVAAAIAQKHKKTVVLIDTNFAAPGLHYFFPTQDINFYLNNYLNKEGNINKAIYNVDSGIKLVPASPKIGDIVTTTSKEIDYKYLCQGLKTIIRQDSEDNIDYLLVDCSPGIQEANLLTMSISDMVLVIFRENQQDWQETTNSLEIITKLTISRQTLIVNQAMNKNQDELKTTIHKRLRTTIADILPQSPELMEFSTPTANNESRLFYKEQPGNIWSKKIEAIADKIVT